MEQFEKNQKFENERQTEFLLQQLLTELQDQEFIMSIPIITGDKSDECKETI